MDLSSLLASLFICGRPSFLAKLTIESVPPSVAEGGSVLLRVHNLQDKLRGLSWYKGAHVSRNLEIARQIIAKNSSVPGPAHSGRETVYSNGSLLLQDVTEKDSGLYTLVTIDSNVSVKTVHVQVNCWGRPVALMSGFEPGMHLGTERKEGI